jgi:hypothetical protein
MTAPAVDPWCGRIVELAARVLPAEQRQRYAREFIAELYGMPRSQQIRHSTQVLTNAWALRTVLNAAGPQLRPSDRDRAVGGSDYRAQLRLVCCTNCAQSCDHTPGGADPTSFRA